MSGANNHGSAGPGFFRDGFSAWMTAPSCRTLTGTNQQELGMIHKYDNNRAIAENMIEIAWVFGRAGVWPGPEDAPEGATTFAYEQIYCWANDFEKWWRTEGSTDYETPDDYFDRIHEYATMRLTEWTRQNGQTKKEST